MCRYAGALHHKHPEINLAQKSHKFEFQVSGGQSHTRCWHPHTLGVSAEQGLRFLCVCTADRQGQGHTLTSDKLTPHSTWDNTFLWGVYTLKEVSLTSHRPQVDLFSWLGSTWKATLVDDLPSGFLYTRTMFTPSIFTQHYKSLGDMELCIAGH